MTRSRRWMPSVPIRRWSISVGMKISADLSTFGNGGGRARAAFPELVERRGGQRFAGCDSLWTVVECGAADSWWPQLVAFGAL